MSQTIKLKRGTNTPTTSNIVSGEVAIDTSAKKLYINDAGTIKEIGGPGTLSVSDIPNLPASKITSGAFSSARIPSLAASKITSGTFAAARIPNLDASKITAGTLGTARIPNLSGAKITSGTVAAARIANLAASKITSGTFDVARLPTIPYSQLSGTPSSLPANGGNSDTVDGVHAHGAVRNNHANKLVRTDSNGYIQAGWINTTSGNNGTTTISRIYASQDGYIRYYTPANFGAQISSHINYNNLTNKPTIPTSLPANGGNADTVGGVGESSFMRKTANSGLNMVNNNITNVNLLTFNDPGVAEGIKWNGGNQWQIYESPDNQTNASGNLQFTSGSGNGVRRMTLNTDGGLFVGTSTTNGRVVVQKADNDTSDHVQFYTGSTRMGEIGSEDTTWLRINQETNKNIYTPRYIRADNGFRVDGSSLGIMGDGTYRAPDGSTTTAAISFSSDTDTGLFQHADNVLGITAGGTRRARFGSTILLESSDVRINQFLYHNGDTDTYLRFDTNRIRMVAGNQTHFDTDYVKLDSYTQGTVPIAVGRMTLQSGGKTGWGSGDELGSIDFYNKDSSGVGARNAARIVAENNTGNGSSTTTFEGELAFYTSPYNSQLNSDPALRLEANNIARFYNDLRVPNGTAGSPSYTFAADTDSGMFSIGSNAVGFATGGTQRFKVNSNGLLLTGGSSLYVNGQQTITNTRDIANVVNYQNTDGHMQLHRTGASPLIINRKGTSSTSKGDILNFKSASTKIARIGYVQPFGGLTYLTTGNTSGCGIGVYSAGNTSGQLLPVTLAGANLDNALDIGSTAARWDDVYATNGTIQTSDRNEKQDIQELTDAEERVATACKGLIRRFRWVDSVTEKGDDARYHFGAIAQDVEAAFTAEGLDAGDYGLFIESTWWEHEGHSYPSLDEAPEGAVEKTRLGIRYNQLFAFIISAL